jgi:hypothetical protein
LVLHLNPSDTEYFLTNPIGNHHVIATGLHAASLKALLQRFGLTF